MQRSRKWTHLAPEARRLAARGLGATAIAQQLGVDRSTVHRWMVSGRLSDTRQSQAVEPASPLAAELPALQWAAAIRAAYTLDPTDAQLVDLAEFALSVIQDATTPPSVRLAAVGRFQSLVKQLASRIRPVASAPPPVPTIAPTARADPRALLNSTIQ